jgi:formamidase
VRIAVDASRPLAEQPEFGHNRWHPELKPIARVEAGSELTIECRDGLDGQLGASSTADDIRRLSLGHGHPLTGPIAVDGARPGDLLEVEILAFERASTGVTAVIPGFGFLADEFPDPYLLVWQVDDREARSEALPGIRVPAEPFPGVIGVAPSHERMKSFRQREQKLRAAGGPVADDVPETAVPALAALGLRTIPPRETGGNLDVRQLVAGSKAFFPVDVPDALFSVGDLHLAQGEGEVCGTALEIAGAITVRFRVHHDPAWRPGLPTCETPGRPDRPAFVTMGIPIDADGRNVAMDLTLAARNALREMLDYLVAMRSLSREAAYALCSVVCDLRIAEAVDIPNPLVAAVLPLDIFDA